MLRQVATLLLGIGALCAVHASQVVLFDFEEGSLNGDWTATGRISVAREPDPVEAEGFAIRIEAAGPSVLSTQPGAIQEDWGDYSELRFRAYLPPDQDPTTIEVQLGEHDANARFTRTVEIDQPGWNEYTVELRWMSPVSGRLPNWGAIQRLLFQFPKPTNIHIDDIALVKIPEVGLEPTWDELLELAYPTPDGEEEIAEDEVRLGIAIDLPHVLLIAPSIEHDPANLLEELAEIRRELDEDLGILRVDAQPILVVLPDRRQFAEFCERLAHRYGRTVEPPTSDGVTILGYAITYWDEETGWERPALIHEYVHSVLDRQARLPSRSEWVHEGFANWYQIRYRESESLETLYEELEASNERSPIARIVTGDRITQEQYPRALSIIDFLIDSPELRERLPLMLQSFASFGTTDLRSVSEPVLGVPLGDLTAMYQEWLRTRLRDLRIPRSEDGTRVRAIDRSAHFVSELITHEVEAEVKEPDIAETASDEPTEDQENSAEPTEQRSYAPAREQTDDEES